MGRCLLTIDNSIFKFAFGQGALEFVFETFATVSRLASTLFCFTSFFHFGNLIPNNANYHLSSVNRVMGMVPVAWGPLVQS